MLHGLTRRLATDLLAHGSAQSLFEGAAPYAELSPLFSPRPPA